MGVLQEDHLVDGLSPIVGRDQVLVGDRAATFWRDWTGRFEGRGSVVVRPATTDEVAGVVAWCGGEGVALVPQGGNTGLVGGSIPHDGEVVLSLTRMSGLAPIDFLARQVSAEAGVTLEQLQQGAASAGFSYGVDLAARGSATVGGMVATNAGGLHVHRHGPTRRQVLGVEAVLGDGRVISHLGGLEKDNTGYDLAGLLCGSEGTLGIVTKARLRLLPRRDERVVALCGFTSVAAAVSAARELSGALDDLDAVELVLRSGVELVCEVFDLDPPWAAGTGSGLPPVMLLVECAGFEDPTDRLAFAVGRSGAAPVAVASTVARRADLWRYREAHTEAVNTLGPPHKLDVTLPLDRLAPFVDQVVDVVAAVDRDAVCWIFGHVLDGNIHVNITGVEPDDDRLDGAVFALVADLGGSISAEHGIGWAKRRYLHLVRSPNEIAAFRAVKAALDPAAILNPNVLLPPP